MQIINDSVMCSESDRPASKIGLINLSVGLLENMMGLPEDWKVVRFEFVPTGRMAQITVVGDSIPETTNRGGFDGGQIVFSIESGVSPDGNLVKQYQTRFVTDKTVAGSAPAVVG